MGGPDAAVGWGVPCDVSGDRCHRCMFHRQGRQVRSASDAFQRLLRLPTWRRMWPWVEEVVMRYACGVGEAVRVIYFFSRIALAGATAECVSNPQWRRQPRTGCWRCRRLQPQVWTPNPNVTRLCHVCVVTHSAWETAKASRWYWQHFRTVIMIDSRERYICKGPANGSHSINLPLSPPSLLSLSLSPVRSVSLLLCTLFSQPHTRSS